MKPSHLIYCLFIFSVSYFKSNAQIIKSLALKGGMSFAEHDWHYKQIATSDIPKTLHGAFSALEIEFRRGKFLSFSCEFSYCEKGHQLSIPITTFDMPDGTGEFTTLKYHFNYLSFSPQVNTRYNMKKWTSYMSVGPRIDQLLWSFIAPDDLDKFDRQTIKSKEILLGMNFSTGIEYAIGKKSIFAEAKFLHDFTKAIDNSNLIVRNRAYILCLGLRFNFVKE